MLGTQLSNMRIFFMQRKAPKLLFHDFKGFSPFSLQELSVSN